MPSTKKTRKHSAILIRDAALASRTAANAAAEEAAFVVNLLEHEPATRDLVIAVKALRGIANAPHFPSHRPAESMRGLARRALADIGLAVRT